MTVSLKMSQCNPSLLLTYSLQAIQKADLRGEAMNYLFIGLLELSFLRELPSRRCDGGENKRTFEVQKSTRSRCLQIENQAKPEPSSSCPTATENEWQFWKYFCKLHLQLPLQPQSTTNQSQTTTFY